MKISEKNCEYDFIFTGKSDIILGVGRLRFPPLSNDDICHPGFPYRSARRHSR